jgi:hypothetical protein
MLWYLDLPTGQPGAPDSPDLAPAPARPDQLAGLFAARPTDLPEPPQVSGVNPATPSRRHLRRQLRADRPE